ncbi:hypothetical protein KCU71_g4028, partial [Aureobasidium melanogenum]
MSRHHGRFAWAFATQNPKDPREVRYNAEATAELNSGVTLAIVDKRPSSTVIDNLRDWEKDAVYEIVTPHRFGHGFTPSKLKLSSPEKHIVGKPSTEELTAAITFGKLIGSLGGGKIVKIPWAEDSTGAIPVMDSEVPGEMFYYIPAQLERLAMSPKFFETLPSFIILKDGEMPSYVFWKRKAEFPSSFSEANLMEQHRAIRSGAPTPEPRPTPVAAPASETRPAPLAVDVAKAAEEEKHPQPMWEIFDPRLEEDPIEFLDYYNVCLNGRKGIRNKLMLREADIDRVNYISPCLAHNHKEIVESGVATAEAEETAMDVDPAPIVPTSKVAGASTHKPTSPVVSKPWVQPGPIPDDDPSWLRLLARQDMERKIRGARIRPKPVFTSEFCNAPGKTSDPKKAVLRRELYDKYYHRAVTANREIESRSKCCLACGLQWIQCTITRHAHYKQHRDELKLYRRHCQNQNILLEDPLRVESLDPAKAPMTNNVPAINWFRDLEQIILNMENELLEREQTCRICDAHVDFADESMADHYQKHANERKQLRTIGAIANSVPTTPTVIVTPEGASFINGSAKSSPAASYHRPSTTPEYIRRIYEKQDEEKVRKALEESGKMADIMVNVAEQIRETGTIQQAHLSPPIILSSGSKSSEPVVAASNDVMDTTEDGPIHSDVVGNTTAQRVFAPLMTPTSPSPRVVKDNLDFLSEYAESQGDNLDFLSTYDADTVKASDVPFEVIVIEDDDSDLYASPVPGPVDPIEEQHTDNDQAEIVQAIRSNSGELLALDGTVINDSEDAEEVLDAEVTESEEAEELPEEFEVDDDELAEEVPKEFGRIEVDYAELSDGSARSQVCYLPDDGLFDNLEPSPELPQDNGLFKSETELDAAKLLAHAIGQRALRKLKKTLNLRQAFVALDVTNGLICAVECESPRHGLVTKEQAVYGHLIDSLFYLSKNDKHKRSDKAPINPERVSLKDVYLTPKDLLDGINLEWYDIWRVVMKAKEALREWVAQNSKDSISVIKKRIVELLRSALMDASLYGYQDGPLPTQTMVPVRHDRLDLRYGDLRIDHILTRALHWGCGSNNLRVLSHQAWEMAIDMIKAERASPSAKGLEAARLRIIHQVQEWVRSQIKKEKQWRRAEGQRLRQYEPQEQWATQATPVVSPANWSTEALSSETPRTPFNSPWTPVAPSTPRKPSSSKESSKRKRPAPLPTPVSSRKRKASDDLFQPGPPTPSNPDEVSPRMPKKPRKSSDPLYRPGSALLDPTTPPVTPRAPKHVPNREADGRFAKKVEEKPKKKQGKKAEKTENENGKKVTFDAAPSSKSSSPALSSPQVVITKKLATEKSTPSAPAKKTSKTVAPKSTKSGVKKTTAEAKEAEPVAAATRPKRQAAIEAEKSFGKTKIVG